MGIAFHLLCIPFQALLHWLHQFRRLQSSQQSRPSTAPPAQNQTPGSPEPQRPPRNNWPFTVRPPTTAHASNSTARPPKVLRQPGTGRLVIAGRMADVCAELDRLAASEAIQV